MPTTSRALILALLSLAASGCPGPVADAPADAGDPDGGRPDSGADADAGPDDDVDAGDDVDDAGPDDDADAGGGEADAGTVADAGPGTPRFGALPLPADLGRGLHYVRTSTPFVSALTVGVTPSTTSGADRYFDAFGATALHLWASGTPDEIAGWTASASAPFAWLSWVFEDGKGLNGEIIGGLSAQAPGRIGFQVGDEPLNAEAVDRIGAGIQAVRAADPEALVFSNLCCADVIDVDAFSNTLVQTYGADLISYDQYDTGDSSYRALSAFREAAVAHNVPYWRYMRSYLDGSQTIGDIDEVDLRWDALVGAVFGYTGHSWFIYTVSVSPDLHPAFFDGPNDADASPTPLFDVAAALNERLVTLGETLNQLTSVDVRYEPYFGQLTQPPGTDAFTPGAGGDPFLVGVGAAPDNTGLDVLVGLFVDDAGERYVMIQNPRHPGADFPSASTAPGTIRLDFDFSGGGADPTRVITLTEAGTLAVVALTPGDDSLAQLDVTLAAGDVLLFKYDTGAPFARRAGTF